MAGSEGRERPRVSSGGENLATGRKQEERKIVVWGCVNNPRIFGVFSACSRRVVTAYQDYTKRAHVSEGLSLAAGAKSAVVEYHADNNEWPADNKAAGLAEKSFIKGNAVTSVEVVEPTDPTGTKGEILITYNDKVEKQTLLLTATIADDVDDRGSYEWDCKTGGTVLPKWRPARCRP
jgi:type IV pilus assembly protein PilA